MTTITVQLSDERARQLKRLARARGMTVEQFLSAVAEREAAGVETIRDSGATAEMRTTDIFRRLFEITQGAPVLPDEALSRAALQRE